MQQSHFFHSTQGIVIVCTSVCVALNPSQSFIGKEYNSFFLPIFLIIFGREILKDLDDIDCDKGYKWTLPVHLGLKKSKIIAAILISLASLFVLALSPKTIVGIIFVIISGVRILTSKDRKKTKRILDVGILMVLTSLLLFGV